MGTLSSSPVAIYQTDKHNCAKQQTQCMAQISKHNGTRTHRLVSQRNRFERLESYMPQFVPAEIYHKVSVCIAKKRGR